MRIKRDDKEHDENVHDESNFKRKMHACDFKKEQLSLNCYEVIRMFTNGVLRTIHNDEYFMSEDTIEEEVKKLNDDVIQDIKKMIATKVGTFRRKINIRV